MLADYFLYFIIYSFIGWLWEGIISLIRDHKIVNRGFLIGPYCPIYGCGALIFLALSFFIHDPVTRFFLG